MKRTGLGLWVVVLAAASSTWGSGDSRSRPGSSGARSTASAVPGPIPLPGPSGVSSCAGVVDYIDPRYDGHIRQLLKGNGHEHNIYYHRNPWNADSSLMIGVQSDLQQQNWRVALYDGDGCFVKELFGISEFDWRLAWDRNDRDVLYTRRGASLYRYHVSTGQVELLRSFDPLALKPSGPSLNQDGDRVLIVTSDSTFRSYSYFVRSRD